MLDVERISACIGVVTTPGAIHTTRLPEPRSSCSMPTDRTQWANAALAAPYDDHPAYADVAAPEPIITRSHVASVDAAARRNASPST